MSFSKELKDELNKVVVKEQDAKKAELAGFMVTNCVISRENKKFILKMTTESDTTIRRMYNSFKSCYGITSNTNVELVSSQKEHLYRLKITNQKDLEKIFSDSFLTINEKLQLLVDNKDLIMSDDANKKAFLRGVFLGSGSCVNPDTRYHLEIVVNNNDSVLFIIDIIEGFGMTVKSLKRKNYYVLYIKGAESISTFLAAIGANQGTLKFEETRVYKEMRNNINRISNFENANYDKTLDASLSQLEDIKLIRKYRRFEKMPDSLKSIARLRLSYKEATFDEIGKMLEPNLSRSGVSHRFKKIHEMAEDLRNEKEGKE